MKTISLIIPVYNAQASLSRCLDSVLQNAYPNLEIICVNDGSTDGSAEILEAYRKQDSRFHILHQENMGVSAARNAGMAAASGELIAFLDADDWLHPQFLEVMSYFLESQNADIIICEHGDPISEEDIEHVDGLKYTWLNGRTMMQDHTAKAYVWGRIFRRSLLDGQHFPVGITLGEDRIFNLSLVCTHPDMRILRLSQKLYCYTLREDSATNTAPLDSWIDLAEQMLHGCKAAQDQEGKQLYLTEAFKLAFSARKADRQQSRKLRIDTLLKACLTELKQMTAVPFVRRIGYRILVSVPVVYRLLVFLKQRRQTR